MDNNTPNSRTARRQQAEAEQKSSRKQKKSPKKKKGIIKTLFKTVVIIGLLFLLAGGGLFAYYVSTAPKLDESLLKDPLSSEILDDNDKVVYSPGTEKRKYVAYADIPKTMEDAILATEDSRFYKHHGIDLWRLGGAVLANIKSGFGSQGASTLTQQVIKNSFFTNEKTLKRKAQEAWLAFKLEQDYTKEEIFEMYFNKVLMSGNKYGFGTGADYFFGKELKDLELPETAMLAGMPQSPNAYNPFKHPERAQKRRDIVLRLMNQHEKISKDEMESAKSVPVTAALLPEEKREKPADLKAQAYIDMVMNELQEAGYDDILKDGVTIKTALNSDAQLAVEKALADPSNFESDTIQAGMTVVDTKTGEIVAVGGGRDYKLFNYNFATDQKRQPGSSIKPILDYGPAIEYLNWSTGQTIVDEKTKGIKANNVDGRYKGAITMREALYNSRNVPAIKAFEEVGSKDAANFAQGLGLPVKKLVQSDAIGGAENEFSTTQMAGAFAAFGNEGIYTKPHTIKKIILRDGKTEINLSPDPVSAMKDSTAYMITDILRDVLTESNGTGALANIRGLDLAGKTGTTNYSSDFKKNNNINSESVPDAWFTGYTTDYTISVWGGHQKPNDPIVGFRGGRDMPKVLFRQVMSELSSGQKPKQFKQPKSVEEATIVAGSQPLKLANSSTPSYLKRDELFVRGTLPEKTYVAPEPEEEVNELEAPTDLSAEYDADNKEIELKWDHNEPDDFDGDVTFAVSVSIDGGGSQPLTETGDNSYTMGNVEPGHTYTFSVVAKADTLVSSPASTTLMIQATEEEPVEEEPAEDEDSDQNDQDNGQDDGNTDENNNDNGNNSGNNNNVNNNGSNNGSNNGNNNDTNNNGNNSNNNNGSDGNNSGDNGNNDNEGDSGDVSSNSGNSSNSNTASSQKPSATKPNNPDVSEE
ncbi:transglycosylase domain-containing protein [Sporosarcina aquimarina]|uniref:PBP1A family penicillin-binding protein n=1 Tax=Sporosarcina aquimarina TaxID=114975 RepID=A0ABU4FWG3_9BACL|nr:PBP1A family penicillin-binding protein [Sporosarcina aquimarina]MDW0109048.1 PBP1A family penicillin-binding protein [Sporosarcina aquimarina]